MDVYHEVDSQDVVVWMNNAMQELGQDPKVVRLNIAGVTKRYNEAKAIVIALQKGTEDYAVPCAWGQRRTEMKNALDAFSAALEDMWGHKACLDKVASHQSTELGQAVRAWRGSRDRIRQYFKDRGVPSALGKMCADMLWMLVVLPSPLNVKIEYFSPECVAATARARCTALYPR